MERIVIRSDDKVDKPPDIDPQLLEHAVRNRDQKQLEWHEPLLVPILQSLRVNGHHQQHNEPQTHPKIYDRLVNAKSIHLFKKLTAPKRPWEPSEDDENVVTLGAPLECYMGAKHPLMTRAKFYADLAPGDLLIGEIVAWRRNTCELKFVCMDGGQARRVLCGDVFIQCQVIQKNEIFEEGDFIRCCLTDVKDELIRATTDGDELKKLDPLLSMKITLGGVERKELPRHYNYLSTTTTASEDRSLVDDLVEPFINPSCTSYLLERLGIGANDRLSLYSDHILPEPKEHEMRDYLRRAQSRDSAQKLVSRGIEQFKKGECSNAMNYYRQALELDQTNVDALVARGALYNSRKQYPLACKDLEEAFRLDPVHKNAKNYLIQILFDQASYMMKMSKSKDELDRASLCLERVLTLDSSHVEARKKLDILKKPSVWAKNEQQQPKSIDEQIRDRLEPKAQAERDLDYEISKKLEELRRKKEKKEKDKKRKKEKKERRSRRLSRSRSRSPKSRWNSSSSSKIITISDDHHNTITITTPTPMSRSRHSSSSSSSLSTLQQQQQRTAEKQIYQTPIRKIIKTDFTKMEAISAKTSDVKGNLKDILGMLGKK